MTVQQTVIFLVRHGETDALYSEDPAIDGKRILTAKGERQMKKVGEYLRNFGPSAIYSSPIFRTEQCAKIIQNEAKIPGEICFVRELYEIYGDAAYDVVPKTMPDFLRALAARHAGAQVVGVSHQDVIEGALRGLGLTSAEAELPANLASVYRLVFAGEKFVECVKLNPAQ